ncbi:MAG: lysine--tRNA ligase [Candidatus Paceibacterota bacterium]
MASIEEIREARLKKISILEGNGMSPYPSVSKRDTDLKDLALNFSKLQKEEVDPTIAGRLLSLRAQGKIMFANIYDGTGEFQVVIEKNELGDRDFSLFKETVDLGDILEFKGYLFETKRGTPSVKAQEWSMLSKSLRPLPEKWHGLQNVEERYRRRYLDILMNRELKDLFEKKSLFFKVMKDFLEERGFMEVHTPSLEVTTGGAEACPFKTHHNDSGMDLFLRISVGELWQKRLMAAGFNRTYEMGRVYRNEGTGSEHLHEFTNMELYASYFDFEKGKKMVKDLYLHLAQEVFGKTAFSTRGHSFDLADEWQDLDYVETVKEMTGIDILEESSENIKKKLEELEVSFEGETRERLIDSLWKYCRKQISGPAFLVNHPKIVAPLSRLNDNDKRLTNTFQVIIAGSELGRAHAELNDPVDQASRFEEQRKLIEAGDEEAMMPDQEYVEMLEYGMPPTFGFGVGERLFAFMADRSIREVTLFPLMKNKS